MLGSMAVSMIAKLVSSVESALDGGRCSATSSPYSAILSILSCGLQPAVDSVTAPRLCEHGW